jgi:hypothetical protein
MDNNQLLSALQKLRAAGKDEAAIRATLLKKKWPLEDINGALAKEKIRTLPLVGTSVGLLREEDIGHPVAKSTFILDLVILILLTALAPGAYGLIKTAVVPRVPQQPVVLKDGLLGYELIQDAPALIIGTTAPSRTLHRSVASVFPHNGASIPVTTSPSTGSHPALPATQTPTPSNVPIFNTVPVPVSPTPVVPIPAVVVPPPAPVAPIPSPAPPTPPPPYPAPVPPTPSGSYPVYPGCEAPATAYARTLYFDPVNGSDTGDGTQAKPYKLLQTLLNARKIIPGDHLILMPGSQADINLNSLGNLALATTTQWTWLDFQPGATGTSLSFHTINKWLVTKPELTYSAGGKILVYGTAVSNLVVADGDLYTDRNSASWTADKWINAVDNGFMIDGGPCISVIRNHITNVRSGIFVVSKVNSPNPSQNSVKALVQNNILKNFSADGMRPIGSDITFAYNGIYDEYVDQSQGDANHDDGIQSYALGGAVYSNIVIDHNWVQETTDPSRPLIGGMQGISSFDGVIKNLRITNNVVITSVWHGMSWYGIQDSLIDHNTIANYTNNGRASWISVPNGKDGSPPSNVTVSNNTAVAVFGAGGVTFTNNIQIHSATSTYAVFNPDLNQYNFSAKPGSILDGTGAGVGAMSPIAVATVHTIVAVNKTGTSRASAAIPFPTRTSSEDLAAVHVANSTPSFFDILFQFFASLFAVFFK